MTYEEILNRMLNRVPNTIDKRQGSIIYTALAPAAYELSELFAELKNVTKQSYADTATEAYLTKRCAERGIYRKSSTKAIRKAEFNQDIEIDDRFGIDGVTFKCIELLDNHCAKLECEQFGTIGNMLSGSLLPLTYTTGLTSAELTDLLIPAEDVETDEELRQRYFDNLDSEAFGGNVADYKAKTNVITGVGGTKVFPAWNGGGTVKLVIIDNTYNAASASLVNEVQTVIDPTINQGQGLGIAPIGHTVTVESVEEVTVNIVSTITVVTGYVWNDVTTLINQAINEYFINLKKTWESENNLVVRISQIESAILRVTGVLDISGTTLNTQETNLILTDKQIPKLGTVTNS